MGIEFVRIDDRLLHGQVVTTWLKKYDIEQVIIVDDKVSSDEFRKKVIKIAAPTELKVVILSVNKFNEVINKTEIKRKTMLLFTNPKDVYSVIKHGTDIKLLNVGNMGKNDKNKQITAGVSVTKEDIDYFKKIIQMGTIVQAQMVPTDLSINLETII